MTRISRLIYRDSLFSFCGWLVEYTAVVYLNLKGGLPDGGAAVMRPAEIGFRNKDFEMRSLCAVY